MKKERGITLIALVVTIIVLLILAGITIAMVVGQNGIFKKAETAQKKTTESQEIEIIKLSMNTIRTNDWENKVVKKQFVTAGELKTEIENKGYTVEVNGGSNLTVKFTNTGSSGNTYLVTQEGKVNKEQTDTKYEITEGSKEASYWYTDGSGTIIWYDTGSDPVPDTLVVPNKIGSEVIKKIGDYALCGGRLERNEQGVIQGGLVEGEGELEKGWLNGIFSGATSKVKKIVVSSGIEEIGNYAFFSGVLKQ